MCVCIYIYLHLYINTITKRKYQYYFIFFFFIWFFNIKWKAMNGKRWVRRDCGSSLFRSLMAVRKKDSLAFSFFQFLTGRLRSSAQTSSPAALRPRRAPSPRLSPPCRRSASPRRWGCAPWVPCPCPKTTSTNRPWRRRRGPTCPTRPTRRGSGDLHRLRVSSPTQQCDVPPLSWTKFNVFIGESRIPLK